MQEVLSFCVESIKAGILVGGRGAFPWVRIHKEPGSDFLLKESLSHYNVQTRETKYNYLH